MSDYCAYISNFLAIGTKSSEKPNGGWIRDKFEWKLSNYKVILKQREDIITKPVSQFRDQWVNSSTVVVENVRQSKVSAAENIIKDLAALLSFASQSQVRFYGNEYPMGSGKLIFRATSGVARFFRPTVDIRNGKNVDNFISQCWPAYRKLKKTRKLNVVFEILTTSEAALLPMEIRLISVFVALENLKNTYAKSNKIPYYKGYFRKVNASHKANLSKSPKYNFEQLLSKMLKERGIKKGIKRIIKLRNDLIHSGISRRPLKSQIKTFENCHEIIREYLLKLLGYRGKYLSYEKPNALRSI